MQLITLLRSNFYVKLLTNISLYIDNAYICDIMSMNMKGDSCLNIGGRDMEFKVGDSSSFSKTITETDVVMYAGISGDLNPAHVNEVEATKGLFGGRVAHGMLVGSLISTVLGTKMPGPGTIYMGQELKFLKPVKFGDTITATATIIEITEKGRARLETICTNQDDVVVISGEALVLLPR